MPATSHAAVRRVWLLRWIAGGCHPVKNGVWYALAGAALFGASTPIAKLLVGRIEPVMLAGLLYAGSGLGLSAFMWMRYAAQGAQPTPLARGDYRWLAVAVLSGGVIGPVLLMLGLTATSASSASLLLNLEGVFTALLAWFAFRENFDRRILFGMFLIVCGGALLAWQPGEFAPFWPALAIAGACLFWAIDNNVTRKISSGDAVKIAAVKGLVAGAVNLSISVAFGTALPALSIVAAATTVGLIGYGVSLVLFIVALRYLGTARAGAYFLTAPFMGAALAFVLLGETPDLVFWMAAALMGAGVALHLTEHHEHPHFHNLVTHTHAHVHDEHHQHHHDAAGGGGEPHTHPHTHEPIDHHHPHYPDIHHRHLH